ncbi:MAG: hypothetical protein JWQ42_3175 [Edaphobacter sp.]|nr:hypothetical protein [Edaphobacter sp.]
MERGRHRGESIFDEDEVMDQVAGRLELLPERESRRAKAETLYRACVEISKQIILKWACAHIEPSFPGEGGTRLVDEYEPKGISCTDRIAGRSSRMSCAAGA